MMDFDGFDQTQAIALDDYSDDTDDLGDPEDRQPTGFLKVFSQKSFNETSFPIYEGDNFVGRHESNEVCIPLKALSRKHACIEIQGDSHLVYDLDSRNKTKRGKLFLKPSVRYELQDSDSLIFGDIRCEYTKAEIHKKPAVLAAESDSDNQSDTGSESMLMDTQSTKEQNRRSSTSLDIEPTQGHRKGKGTNETTIVVETPQREGATLIIETPSDENGPQESVKAKADSSLSPESIAETPTAKPLAESTVINQSELEEVARSRRPDSDDITEPAAAPTQVFGHFAEMETQPYPANQDYDQDFDEDIKGKLHFDEPTQAYGGLDDDNEMMGRDQGPKGKRKSTEPTLMLNLSTDDDEDSPIKRPGRPKPYPRSIAEEPTLAYDDHNVTDDADKTCDDGATLAFPEIATQAYCDETDEHPDDDERNQDRKRGTTKDDLNQKSDFDSDGPTLAFPDLATQAYCPDTDEHSDDDCHSKSRATKIRGRSSDDGDMSTLVFPDLATQAYCIDTDDQSDEERPHAKDSKDDASTLEFQDLATQAYCADSDDQSENDTKRKSAKGRPRGQDLNKGDESVLVFADLATQAYCAETDEESDDEADTRNCTSGTTLDPTLKYDMEVESATTCGRKLGPTLDPTLNYDMQLNNPLETKNENDDELLTGHCDEPTLAYDDINDEPMDTEMSLDEGRKDRMLGYADMPTQPIGETYDSDTKCQPDDSTETEDDTTAATQAYGADSGDENINENPSTSAAGLDRRDGSRGMTEGEAGPSSAKRRKVNVESEDEDFVMATQVYGLDNESETQVPDSQEGVEEEDTPLPGISRISSMLRKVPARSAMASPEKKQQRALKVAFKEQTPPEENTPEEINPPTRRSVRGRKVPVRFQETKTTTPVTETDAKPTRRRSKDFRLANDGVETQDAPQQKKTSRKKRKGSQDVVEGLAKPVEQDSEEDTLEIKEVEGMVWRSIGKVEDQEMNNNETETRDKLPARRTSRRQASYKKAVDGHDSDDTESLSSTSSLQQEVGEVTQSNFKIHVTVSDGNKTEHTVKPRRGRRSNAAKVDKPAEEAKPASGRRQSRLSAATKNDVVETPQSTKTRSGRGRKSKVSELEDIEHDSIESKGKQSNRRSTLEDTKVQVTSTEAKEPTTRRGRKSKSTPPATGPKQSAITDYAVKVSTDKTPAKNSQDTDSLESTQSISLLQSSSTKTTPRSNSTKTDKPETKTSPADQDSFLAPEPVKRRGRGRPPAKKKEGQGSTEASIMTPMGETMDQLDSATGRKSLTLETPKTDKPVATPSSGRRGKRAAPTEVKPKVMFTGVVNKAWEKIVIKLGGELVESVFNCTHLVTDKVRRTVKFLCCLSRSALIIMPTWLEQCQIKKAFVDSTPYLLIDKESEKQYGFSHKTSHQRALQGGALLDICVFVTPGVKPQPAQMKEIIQCAGGKYLSSLPKKPAASTIVISCEADEVKCQPAIKAGLQIVSAEFILTGMLRQESRPELYQLFPPSLGSDHGKRKKVIDTPAASKRKR